MKKIMPIAMITLMSIFTTTIAVADLPYDEDPAWTLRGNDCDSSEMVVKEVIATELPYDEDPAWTLRGNGCDSSEVVATELPESKSLLHILTE